MVLTIENDGRRIFVFHNDHYEVDDDFKPYFYYENKDGGYVSLLGHVLSKVYVDRKKRYNYKGLFKNV